MASSTVLPLLLLLLVAAGTWRPLEAQPPPVALTHLVFSLQWGPAFCENERTPRQCVRVRDFWTIHGMWPASGSTTPRQCPGAPSFDVRPLARIRSRLEMHWPSLIFRDSQGFWEHEWKEHGTCATGTRKLNGVFNYFDASLDLHLRHSVGEYLKRRGITPDISRTYSVNAIKAVLSSGLGAAVNVQCGFNPRKYRYPLLEEVRWCLNPVSLDPVPCPFQRSNCGSDVLYLPYKPIP